MFESNLLENKMTASRFVSPSLRMAKIKSVQFDYKSPSRAEKVQNEEQLNFNTQTYKLVVRKLPKFHQQIYDDEPAKQSKIIQNISFLREQEKNKEELGQSRLMRNKSNTVIVNN